MHIKDFIGNYKNHPVLFVGTGVSLRYLKDSHTWDGLLRKIAGELTGGPEYYLDIKSLCEVNGKYNFSKIAGMLEKEFNSRLLNDRNGKFKDVNDKFYSYMESGKNISRLKIHIADILSGSEFREDKADEIALFKQVRKNIGSIITTNYDTLIEKVFDFIPLVGNDILLSNPYGSVYKIHGCVSDAQKIIITESDYERFSQKYELIRAQLLSIFIHNPIIFLGYNIGDENIKDLLKTIFTYVEPNSVAAEKIRSNFLLVEHDSGSMAQETSEHDIDIEGFATLRINKIKTDDFSAIFRALAELMLPISAMDIRKVQSIVKEIYAGGKISVHITEDLDSMDNSDRILAIGSNKTIQYQFLDSSSTIVNYFSIIEEANSQAIKLIDKYRIQRIQYFPIFGFSSIYPGLESEHTLKDGQTEKLRNAYGSVPFACRSGYTSIAAIIDSHLISPSSKHHAILWSAVEGKIELEDLEDFLRIDTSKKATNYRKLLCVYDYLRYGGDVAKIKYQDKDGDLF
jgi:hypothetical protein